MSNIQIWMGGNIGHGRFGGVLSVAGHDIKVGDEVPVNLLSKSALKSFREKGSIVDKDVGKTDKKEDPNPLLTNAKKLVKTTNTAIAKAKKELTSSGKKLKTAENSVIAQQKIIKDLPEGEEEGKIQAEESLGELKDILDQVFNENKAFELTVDNAQTAADEAKKALANVES